MDRDIQNQGRARPNWDKDQDAQAANQDQPGRTEYSSTGTGRGREGFTGGEDLSDREDFTARENVTEERQDLAIDQNEPATRSTEGGKPSKGAGDSGRRS